MVKKAAKSPKVKPAKKSATAKKVTKKVAKKGATAKKVAKKAVKATARPKVAGNFPNELRSAARASAARRLQK